MNRAAFDVTVPDGSSNSINDFISRLRMRETEDGIEGVEKQDAINWKILLSPKKS